MPTENTNMFKHIFLCIDMFANMFVLLQIDDGFMEEHNVVLDALQMDILEKHHHDNMQIMASMLARVCCNNIYTIPLMGHF